MKAYYYATIDEIEYDFHRSTINNLIKSISEFLEAHPDHKFVRVDVCYDADENVYQLEPEFAKVASNTRKSK